MANYQTYPKYLQRQDTAVFKTNYANPYLSTRSVIYEAIKDFETQKGRPPYQCEIIDQILVVKKMTFCEKLSYRDLIFMIIPRLRMGFLIQDMIYDDVLYSDPDQIQIATRPWDDKFKKASERKQTEKAFIGLSISEKDQSFESGTREQICFDELFDLLRSKDMAKYEEYKYLDDGVLRFLDKKPITTEKVAYMTFPRSGNTFLRKYMEIITGVPTGSDMPHFSPMPLHACGLIGEHIVDDRCWIIKTHHPHRMLSQDFSANKVLICVRNPFDSMKSMAFMISSLSHSMAIENDLPMEEPVFFNKLFEYFLKVHIKFQNEVLKIVKERKFPVYFTKFEELTKETEEELYGVFKFLLNLDSLEGTVAEVRIKELLAMDASKKQAYRMKPKDEKYKTAQDMFTKEQQDLIFSELKEFCQFFGYFHPGKGQDHAYSKFTYPSYVSPCESEYCQYKIENEKTLAWNLTLKDTERKSMKLEMKGFKISIPPPIEFSRPIEIKNPYKPEA